MLHRKVEIFKYLVQVAISKVDVAREKEKLIYLKKQLNKDENAFDLSMALNRLLHDETE